MIILWTRHIYQNEYCWHQSQAKYTFQYIILTGKIAESFDQPLWVIAAVVEGFHFCDKHKDTFIFLSKKFIPEHLSYHIYFTMYLSLPLTIKEGLTLKQIYSFSKWYKKFTIINPFKTILGLLYWSHLRWLQTPNFQLPQNNKSGEWVKRYNHYDLHDERTTSFLNPPLWAQ